MEEADIVVVGGGSGGAAVAGRLSEDGKYSVAVIEAGGRNDGLRTIVPGLLPMQSDASNWRLETVPQIGLNGRRGFQPRGKGLGGSSAINAMCYIRGNAWDYDHWAANGCPGWSYAEVLPWFRNAEHNVRGADAYHGDSGPLWVSDQTHTNPGSLAFIEAAQNLQIPRNDDFNGATQEGIGFYQVTQKGGERWSSARAYLDPGKDRPNLHVLTNAVTERILFDEAAPGESPSCRAARPR
ncbi:hypothetical protein BH09PSE4_BH09PSE4_19190 [soil metagenome]